MVRWAADNVGSAIIPQKTRLINPKIRQSMSCQGKAGDWANARVERAAALEKVRVKARAEAATADQNLVCRPLSTQ